jgi:hypothetical protein
MSGRMRGREKGRKREEGGGGGKGGREKRGRGLLDSL